MTDESDASALADAVHNLADTVEIHDQRLSTLETPRNAAGAASDADTDSAPDRRVRTRRRGPLLRQRHVAGHHSDHSTADDATALAAWVDWLRGRGLADHIPADWNQIPLVASELDALHRAWLSCRHSRQPSFDWVHWHDGLARSLARIDDWKAQHQRQQGLSTLTTHATPRTPTESDPPRAAGTHQEA